MLTRGLFAKRGLFMTGRLFSTQTDNSWNNQIYIRTQNDGSITQESITSSLEKFGQVDEVRILQPDEGYTYLRIFAKFSKHDEANSALEAI